MMVQVKVRMSVWKGGVWGAAEVNVRKSDTRNELHKIVNIIFVGDINTIIVREKIIPSKAR